MNMLWISNELVLEIIKLLFKHRQSMGKVKLLWKVYRGVAALLQKVAVN